MSYYSGFKLRKAVQQLKAGKIVAYPTEAVYGLGCDPLNANAVLHLLHLKKRPVYKGLIVIGSDLAQLEPYVQLDEAMRERILAHLSEPTTWLVPAQHWTPNWLTGDHDTLAIRVTSHPLAQALCQHYGKAIVSTSANINTQPAIKTKQKLIKTFAKKHNLFFLHGSLGNLVRETAIYDIRTGQRLR